MRAPSTRVSLLARVRDSADDSAWREFDARYSRLIVRYALRRGLQRSDAEDVRQLVMMKLANALRGFRYEPARGRFRDYLGRAVRNAVATFLLRHSRQASGVDTQVLASTAVDACAEERADAAWEREWMLHHYRMAVETLRGTFEPRSVQVFDALLAGEPVEDLSRRFRLSREAIYKVKRRVRDRLQEIISAQIEDEELPPRP